MQVIDKSGAQRNESNAYKQTLIKEDGNNILLISQGDENKDYLKLIDKVDAQRNDGNVCKQKLLVGHSYENDDDCLQKTNNSIGDFQACGSGGLEPIRHHGIRVIK